MKKKQKRKLSEPTVAPPSGTIISEQELWEIAGRLGLPAEAKRVVDSILRDSPVRAVRGGPSNVTGSYPSTKMGRMISYESRTAERTVIQDLEMDDRVLAYFSQPFAIPVRFRARGGRWVNTMHVPDFFVIRRERFEFLEMKTIDGIERQLVKSPGRWAKRDGKYFSPPAERWARGHGFGYEIKVAEDYSATWRQNADYLDDYLRSKQVLDPTIVRRVLQTARRHLGCTIGELMEDATVDLDTILLLVARRNLHCDLHAQLLRDRTTKVFPGPDHRQLYDMLPKPSAPGGAILRAPAPGDRIEWNGVPLRILFLSGETATLQREDLEVVTLHRRQLEEELVSGRARLVAAETPRDSPARRLLGAATEEEIDEALDRQAILAGKLYREDKTLKHVGLRTLLRWKARYRAAKEIYECGILGLLPGTRRRGNRTPRIDAELRERTAELIRIYYRTLVRRKAYSAYLYICGKLKSLGHRPPPAKTFYRLLRGEPVDEMIRDRKGRKAAYYSAEYVPPITVTTPPHGDYPFHVVHVDATELDIVSVCEETGLPLGRPWLTMMIDAFSREVLGYWLAFDRPGAGSTMAAIRAVGERHGRMPQTIVTDNGKEFRNRAMQLLLAAYEAEQKYRPPSKARYGSVLERLFGTLGSRLLHNLSGNTQALRDARSMDSRADPRIHAVWTLSALHNLLSNFFDAYSDTIHTTLGETPRARFARGMEQHGARTYRLISDRTLFKILTAPPTPIGQATVQPGMGVKVHYLYYWHPAFQAPKYRIRGPRGQRPKVDVRYEPSDISRVYARVDGDWVECLCRSHAELRGKTVKQLQIAALELRRRLSRAGRSRGMTEERLVAMTLSVETQEMQLQTARDNALRGIRPRKPDLQSRQSRANGNGSTPHNAVKRDAPNGASRPPAPPPPPLNLRRYKPRILPRLK